MGLSDKILNIEEVLEDIDMVNADVYWSTYRDDVVSAVRHTERRGGSDADGEDVLRRALVRRSISGSRRVQGREGLKRQEEGTNFQRVSRQDENWIWERGARGDT